MANVFHQISVNVTMVIMEQTVLKVIHHFINGA